jgi:hypothetical protein
MQSHQYDYAFALFLVLYGAIYINAGLINMVDGYMVSSPIWCDLYQNQWHDSLCPQTVSSPIWCDLYTSCSAAWMSCNLGF